MAGILGDIVDLAKDIVDRIPKPDPEIRRTKLIARLTRRKVRLEETLRRHPNNVEAKVALAGVTVELERIERLEAAEVPAVGDGTGAPDDT